MSGERHITWVFYYVPEDGEDGNDLNAFPVYKKIDDIRLTDIQENFPLPGKYHFRFQHLYHHNMLVWLDLNNEKCQLPQIEGQIIVKALRLNWESAPSVSHSTSSNSQGQRQRHSEPEEHKDLDNLLGDDDSHKPSTKSSSNQTRHSHVQDLKSGSQEKDPFEGIDFSLF